MTLQILNLIPFTQNKSAELYSDASNVAQNTFVSSALSIHTIKLMIFLCTLLNIPHNWESVYHIFNFLFTRTSLRCASNSYQVKNGEAYDEVDND